MILAFYKGKGRLFDRLIRWWTCGPFSHVEIVLDMDKSGSLGMCLSASPREGRVREKLIDFTSGNWQLVSVPSLLPLDGRQVATNAIGREYDWLGIALSQVFPTARQDRRKWFCSELCAAAMGLTDPHRYSPNSLFNLCQDLARNMKATNAE